MREAAIRSLVYIGLAGPGVDERAFEVLRQMRAEHGGLTLEEFKQIAARAVLRPAARPGRRAGRDSPDAARRLGRPGQRRSTKSGRSCPPSANPPANAPTRLAQIEKLFRGC